MKRLAIIPLLLALSGCGSKNAVSSRFVPSPQTARKAIESALEAWQKGQPTGGIANTTPKVQVVDENRPAGQRLARFEILGEVPGSGPRTFSVKLETENPAAVENTRYVVVGIDPLWVFRQFDYDKMAHWEMDMKGEE